MKIISRARFFVLAAFATAALAASTNSAAATVKRSTVQLARASRSA